MPELPEVETTMAGLRRMFADHNIVDVICRRKLLRYPVDALSIVNICKSHHLVEILRRGKYMIWRLSSTGVLLVHLGMSGRFCLQQSSQPPDRHDHVRFILDNNMEIRYCDPRRFGLIIAIKDGQWQKHSLLSNLGMEPLVGLDFRKLRQIAQKRSIGIRQFIMDQKVIVGVGNIYASEALFLSAIHPQITAASLTLKKWQELTDSIKRVLTNAIAAGGTTLNDDSFLDIEGNHGKFQIELNVYGREGKQCRRCNEVIVRQTIAGRSAFFCPSCQKQKTRR